ncbi:MarR family winged helix-turn-helix transcriptional regulator [Phytomonospora endophytica]|uniref:DNA-binding MarR family transcriptional regulator n=1 Tax=Phytomonospora endophytica TaxID=714109 RepID=A0A841FT20_9ACTN|nr:MarR family transcriptional regulator [Phytomonospora endophytica]MBB6038954.1 DNA-binding MarR family transcriptional regulator [Phytomonospora endophytica]GIG67942.1 MarR family transcriptional regulator [Phytomonospora endophytica]
MAKTPEREAVGTLLRHVHDLLDGDVARAYPDLGLPAGYRPRYSPVMRALAAHGPMPIRDLAEAVGVTHSAASQSVAQMARDGLLELRPGTDARQRVAHLSEHGEGLLPAVHREWTAVATAMRDLDEELPAPLAEVLLAVLEAVEGRSLRERIVGVARRT